jgi:AcrR family transcriptional regulator
MARPSQLPEKRRKLIPVVARAFAEQGYRRMTTAELARRCGLRENVLYRLWPDKKAMFMAAIDYVFDLAAQTWAGVLHDKSGDGTAAQRLLTYEGSHLGEFGMHRIVFAGLSELDDKDIREALGRMYSHFQSFIRGQLEAHRGKKGAKRTPEAELAAWAVIGLGTVSNIARELGLVSSAQRRRLMEQVGACLLEGNQPARES